MRRSSAREGQIEPFAALVAVVVVGLALGIYAGAFEASVPDPLDRNVAEPTADRVERALTVGGVVRLDNLGELDGTGPAGYELNVTLDWGQNSRSAGSDAPGTADVARRRVSVLDGPGDVVPGRLEVRVWT